MSMLLAFRVARPVTDIHTDINTDIQTDTETAPPDYDAELQALAWTDEYVPAQATGVCTRRPKGYNSCSGGGTACRMSGSGCFDPFYAYCYECDY
jgi:hypothetical protein